MKGAAKFFVVNAVLFWCLLKGIAWLLEVV